MSTKTIRYTCGFQNIGKTDTLKKIDMEVLELKNQMSKYVFEHIDEFLLESKYTFVSRYKRFQSDYLSAWEIQTLFNIVMTAYDNCVRNKFKAIEVRLFKGFKYSYYKKNVGTHKIGDVKRKYRIEPLSKYNKLIRFLVWFKDLDHIQLTTPFGKDAIKELRKFKTFNRKLLKKIVGRIRAKIISSCKCIEFTTGSYMKFGYTSTSKKNLVFQDDDTNTKYKNWYCYRIKGGEIWLPVEVNVKYHPKDYSNAQHYAVMRNNKLMIFTSTEVKEPVFKEKVIVEGVDVNVKHNLFTLSNGTEFDYDRKYLQKLVKQIQKLDKRGNKKSEHQLRHLQHLYRSNESYFRKLVHDLLDYCEDNQITDLVMEDLGQFSKSFIKSDEFNGVRFSRLVRMLRLSNLKNWVLEQAEKRGIRVHTTPPYYTSQACPICGCIDKENRKTQETFCCINCGHTMNADHNAAINIWLRYVLDVLRQSKLHNFDSFNRMVAGSISYRSRQIVENLLAKVYAST